MSEKTVVKQTKSRLSFPTQLIIGMIVGLLLGIIFKDKIAPIKVVGDIFLRLVMMSVPILLLGVVTEAVGSISYREIGKVGLKTISWFLITTIIAAAIGMAIGLIFKPGVGMSSGNLETAIKPTDLTIDQIILNFFPSNVVGSLSAGNNMQVIIFALFLGIATSIYVDKTGDRTVLNFIISFNKTILTIIRLIMKVAPIGVAALLAYVAGTMGIQVIGPLVKYLVILLVACFLFLLTQIFITATIVKVNSFALIKKLLPMSIIAFTTTSSAMSLPIQMSDSVTKLGISKRISELVNPLGMVINSTGQALFLSVASIMLFQFFNVEITVGRLIQTVVLSTLACMGTPAVPGGALVVLAGLMPSLGIPIEGLALIAGVDWFRGAITTVPNVAGDALVALIIAKGENEFSRDVFDGKVVIEDPSAVTNS